MIIVTGTMRSGTSMWMQILRAAGIEVVGEAFPRDWGTVIREANPEGFFESPWRDGIYYRTNPDPKTGVYLDPARNRNKAIKIFMRGLERTDLAFIDKVVVTVRHWREYHHSLNELFSMEQHNRQAEHGRTLPPRERITPALGWWMENYALLRDFLIRRYPIHMVAYEAVLAEPATAIGETLQWLGVGDTEAAVAQVKPDLRHQERACAGAVEGIEASTAQVFDELYDRVLHRRGLDGDFIDALNATQEALEPRIREERQRAASSARRHRRALAQQLRQERSQLAESGERVERASSD